MQKVQLVLGIKTQMRLLDHLKQMSLLGDDKKTVYIGPAVWLATRGYILKDDELNKKKC